MAKQEITGKAFEFACIEQLYIFLKDKLEVALNKDKNYENVKKAFINLSEKEQKDYMLAAKKAISMIIPLEPNLEFPDSDDILELGIQSDKQGQKGDVRDVICIRNKKGWEIGFSCKHNHEAVKHSRLSATIDFGKQWLGYNVSQDYWNKVKVLFDELDELKLKKARWAGIEKKDTRFYVPILRYFLDEIQKIYSEHKNDVPKKLMQYLLGRYDFYKIITHTSDRTTEVKPFNIYGTLGQSTKNKKVLSKVNVLKMPTKILSMEFKENSKTTVLIYMDEGWALSLRIHNASEWVEPSLKFDVQLIGVPSNMGTRIESWEEQL